MLIGHYAPALALKAAVPRLPLWLLLLATQAVDVLWGLLVLAGVEHVRIVPGFTASNDLDLFDMPWSHSVVATVGWATLAGLVAAALARTERARIGAAIAAAVASHFVLDWIVHVPDLPVCTGDGDKLGLGLWQHLGAALAVEAALFALGIAVLLRSGWANAPARRTPLRAMLAAMMALLVISFALPTPPTPIALAISALGMYAAIAAAAAWVDRRGGDA